jgi:hypothetical protein
MNWHERNSKDGMHGIALFIEKNYTLNREVADWLIMRNGSGSVNKEAIRIKHVK